MRTLWIFAVVIMLAACTPKYAPYPDAQWPTYERQAQIGAAVHWQRLADNEAHLIAHDLPAQSIYIETSRHTGEFGTAYKEFLTTALLKNNISVTRDSFSRYHLEYDTQVIHHDRDEIRFRPGTASAIGAGAFLIDQAADWGGGDSKLGIIPFIAAADLAAYFQRSGDTPDTEVIITTRVVVGDRIQSSATRVYYVTDGGKYKTGKRTGKTFYVEGD